MKLKHLDEDSSVFFVRELEKVLNNTYDIKYAELKARTFIPVNTEEDEAADYITYEVYDMFGMAKIVESYAKDFPRVDVVATEEISKVKSLGDSYGYSIQDIRKAARANKPLVSRKANVAKRAIMQKENKLALMGDAKCGFLGFFNHPNVPVLPSALNWAAGANPDEVLDEMNKLANSVIETTEGVEIANTLIMPIAQYTYTSSTKMSSDSSMTILEMFLKSNPNITDVDWSVELKEAGAGGTARAMVYKRDPLSVEMHVPKEFEQFEPHLHAMEYVVHCHQRFGGVLFYYPLSAAYMDGI